MKSKIDWVRRGQRVIRMVAELHRMGYQRLRIMPYQHPNAWRLAVGPRDLFSERNGAFIPHETLGIVPISSAGGYFDWEDAKVDDARTLAQKFVTRFPETAHRGHGRDWAYAGWLAELMGFLEDGDWLPVTYWENMKGTPEQLQFLPIWNAFGQNTEWQGLESIPAVDVKNFPLPPSWGKSESQIGYDDDYPGAITLLKLASEGGTLELALHMTSSGIYSYALTSRSSKHAIFDDVDLSEVDVARNYGYMDAPLVVDWYGALRLLDDQRWPWPLLTPLYVHPSISGRLIEALKMRYGHYPDIDFGKWELFF